MTTHFSWMHRNTRFFFRVLLALLIGGSTSCLVAQSQSGFTYNGMVYTSYQANEYQETPQGPQGAAAIRATGANYASVVTTQYEQTYTSNTIAPETASTPGYISTQDPLSPTDASVVAAIQNLQAQGLTVFLKPQVDSLDGVFRGQFAPTDPAAWFASYQTFILHYAQLASQNGVGTLVIGTEFVSMTGSKYETEWDNIIAQIRASYPSLTLAYGANATGATDEFTTVSFWDKVDIIGVDGYFPLTDQVDPTVAQLVSAWTNNEYGLNVVAALKALQAKYNKPLIFTELGYVSAAGTNEAPYSSAMPGAALDPTEQANCYEAFFEVFSQQTSWMKGVFWWAWNVSPPGAGDEGYTPQNKAAGTTILPKWYGSTTSGFTLAPSNPILTLQAGSSETETIAATELGGFSGSIALATTGLPSGVTGAVTAGSVAGTQVLTLTAANAAVTGPAAVTVTGTSGALTASTGIALTVQPLPVNQTITFPQPSGQITGTPLTLTATASSGLPVTYTAATQSVCAVSASVATFFAGGTCTIDANQAGDAAYNAAPQVQVSFSVVGSPSFTIASSSPSLTAEQGQETAAAIVITDANGFTGPVTFSASGLPSGVTASFGASPATTSSPITFAIANSTATGTYSIIVTGASGALSTSTIITLTVSAAPAITLSGPTSAVSLASGGTGIASISVIPGGTFSGTVTLTAAVTSSPQGAQDPPQLSFGKTSPVTVSSASPGTASLTITTTPAATAALSNPTRANKFIVAAGGSVLACFLLLGMGLRRRQAVRLLSLAVFVLMLAGGLVGCKGAGSGGGSTTSQTSSGTTAGNYVVTVTATSGSATALLTVPISVQ